MQYYILREDKEYGPYTLDYIRRYVDKGNIQTQDWARVEGVDGKFYVSELLSGRSVNGQPLDPAIAPPASGPSLEIPKTPSLHWGAWFILLGANNVIFYALGARSGSANVVLRALSCLLPLLLMGWQSVWAKKLEAKSRALIYLAIAAALILIGQVLMLQRDNPATVLLGAVLVLSYMVFWQMTAFNLRRSVERCYLECDGVARPLSGVMTFFFTTIYIQYHLNEIAKRMAARNKAQGDLFTGA